MGLSHAGMIEVHVGVLTVVGWVPAETPRMRPVDKPATDDKAEHRRKLLGGGRWLGLARMATRVLAVLKNVIIARVLAPEAVGMAGLVFLCLSVAEALTNVRMNDALLSTGKRIRDNANAAWTIGALRGVLLAGALLAVAPVVMTLLDAPELVPLLRAIAVVPLLRGLQNPLMAEVAYQLDFRRIALFQIGGTTALNFATIAALLIVPSVWSIIVGMLIGEAATLVFSYIMIRFRPGIELRWERMRVLVQYGAWMTLTGIVLLLSAQLDSWVISVTLGLGALGYYEVARRFSVGFLNDIVAFVHGLTMPSYATLADDIAMRRLVLIKAVQVIAFVGMPFAVVMVMLGRDGVVHVLGDKWLPAVVPLQILSVSGLIIGVQTTAGPLFYALGKPKRDFWMNLGRPVVLGACLVPMASTWGTAGAAGATVVAALSLVPVWLWQIRDLASVTAGSVLRALAIPALFSAATAGSIAAVGTWVSAETFVGLVANCAVGAATYGALVTWLGLRRQQGPVAWLRGR